MKEPAQAEASRYTVLKSRDEILTKAKEEGKLRIMTALVGAVKPTTDAFKKKYPFIDVQEVVTTRTIDQNQRALLEIKSGVGTGWDIARVDPVLYSEFLPYLRKFDLQGMSEAGILNIPAKMIDPRQRNISAILSRFQVTAYNRNLVPPDQVPKTWEDILKPFFKDRKFAVDIHPQEIAALVPAWGMQKVLDFARRIAAQRPIWRRGGTRTIAAAAAGEIPLFLGPNYDSVKGFQRRDPLGIIQFVILEPVPVRISGEHAVLSTSRNPHAALLWLEWVASRDAQALIDQHEPLASSLYVQGSAVEQELRGKRLSVVSWEENASMEQWIPRIVEAYGFPTASDSK
jgi:ABC-type Fe3+ transport system substrate-binding protein